MSQLIELMDFLSLYKLFYLSEMYIISSVSLKIIIWLHLKDSFKLYAALFTLVSIEHLIAWYLLVLKTFILLILSICLLLKLSFPKFTWRTLTKWELMFTKSRGRITNPKAYLRDSLSSCCPVSNTRLIYN